jgi:hypothetical protein
MLLRSVQVTEALNNCKTAMDDLVTGPFGSQAINTAEACRNALKASFKMRSGKLGATRVTTTLAHVVLVGRPGIQPTNPVATCAQATWPTGRELRKNREKRVLSGPSGPTTMNTKMRWYCNLECGRKATGPKPTVSSHYKQNSLAP